MKVFVDDSVYVKESPKGFLLVRQPDTNGPNVRELRVGLTEDSSGEVL